MAIRRREGPRPHRPGCNPHRVIPRGPPMKTMPAAALPPSASAVARRLTGATAFAVLLVAAGSAARADGETFSFGLWGDMPYARAKDQPKIAPLIADMNASDIAFSLYDGDIKDGSSKCSDDVYTDAIKMFDALQKPAVYVPGDNEWTDCHRTNNGGYDNLERLDHLRKAMFTDTESFGQSKMPLD